MDTTILRATAGATAALVFALGVYLSGRVGRSSQARIEELRAERIDIDVARAEAASRRKQNRYDPLGFLEAVQADAESFDVSVDVDELGQPQAYKRLLDEPIVLGPNRSLKVNPLDIRITHEKVRYQQHGAMVSARHSVATVTNTGERAVAYRVRLRSHERGRCEVRGTRIHNTMALLPGEVAQIVVCAGGGRVRIEEVEVLEVTDLGYWYLSKVPPVTVGHDDTTAASHAATRRVSTCTTVDAKDIAALLEERLTRWVDVVDFYSRHNCERFRFFREYRHQPNARSLPAVPPEREPSTSPPPPTPVPEP